jgi:hypothetical protein
LAGVGCAFSYDAVGSFERVRYSSSGTGQTLVQPLLDNQVCSCVFFGLETVLYELLNVVVDPFRLQNDINELSLKLLFLWRRLKI